MSKEFNQLRVEFTIVEDPRSLVHTHGKVPSRVSVDPLHEFPVFSFTSQIQIKVPFSYIRVFVS